MWKKEIYIHNMNAFLLLANNCKRVELDGSQIVRCAHVERMLTRVAFGGDHALLINYYLSP